MRRSLCVLLLCASEALAHADLVSSTPADGTTLATSPERIELHFNEPVRPITLRLVDRHGKALALPPPELRGETISIRMPGALAEGHYTLSFRVTSLDSHPVGGSIVFGVGTAPPSPAPSAAGESPARVALRFVRDVALLLAAGGALFVLALGGFPGHARLLRAAAFIAAVAAAAAIGMQGAALLGEWNAAAWGTGFHSSFGLSACLAILGMLAIASLRRAWMAGGATVALASLPLTGHALSAHPAWLAMSALTGHALAAAFWAGSLAALFIVVRREPLRAAAALRRFSPFGVAAVVLLVVSALALAFVQLEAWADLAASPYGRFLSIKAALLTILVVLALINRFRLLPALERGEASAAKSLGRSIAGEGIVLCAVLGVTAFLVQTPPPEPSREQTLVSGAHTAVLSVVPARAGPNLITVRIQGAEELLVELANAAAGIEPVVRPMRRIAPDLYRYEASELAFPGAWAVTVHARIGDFDRIAFPARVLVR